jgi:hypothetical protein
MLAQPRYSLVKISVRAYGSVCRDDVQYFWQYWRQFLRCGTLLTRAECSDHHPPALRVAKVFCISTKCSWPKLFNGVKTEDVKHIFATYGEDAVDCGSTGECLRGRLQIERQMTTQLASLGRARSAAVKT